MPHIPQSAVAVNLIASVLLGMTAILLAANIPFSWIICFVAALYYITPAVVAPMFESQFVEIQYLREAIPDRTIHFRQSDKHPTRALDLIFRKYIIINSNDLAAKNRIWRALIHHEYAHLKNGDTKLFHFAGIAGLIVVAHYCLVIALATVWFGIRFWNSGFPSINFDLSALLLSFFLLVLTPVVFFLWIRKSLHDREYLADAHAATKEYQILTHWLQRRADREERRKVHPILNLYTSFAGQFTHPSMQSRYKMVVGEFNGKRISASFEIIKSCTIALFSFALAVVFIDTAPKMFADSSIKFEAYEKIGVLIVFISLGFSAISLTVKEIWDTGGTRMTVYAIILFAAIYFAFLIVNFSGGEFAKRYADNGSIFDGELLYSLVTQFFSCAAGALGSILIKFFLIS